MRYYYVISVGTLKIWGYTFESGVGGLRKRRNKELKLEHYAHHNLIFLEFHARVVWPHFKVTAHCCIVWWRQMSPPPCLSLVASRRHVPDQFPPVVMVTRGLYNTWACPSTSVFFYKNFLLASTVIPLTAPVFTRAPSSCVQQVNIEAQCNSKVLNQSNIKYHNISLFTSAIGTKISVRRGEQEGRRHFLCLPFCVLENCRGGSPIRARWARPTLKISAKKFIL